MKSFAKILLVGAVAMTAVAFMSIPSQAAKKAAAAPCVPGIICTGKCKGDTCKVMACDYQGKWSAAVFTPTCVKPGCPLKCS